MKHQSNPYRIYFAGGYVVSRCATLPQVATDYPNAIRIERTDVAQPPRMIEDDSGE